MKALRWLVVPLATLSVWGVVAYVLSYLLRYVVLREAFLPLSDALALGVSSFAAIYLGVFFAPSHRRFATLLAGAMVAVGGVGLVVVGLPLSGVLGLAAGIGSGVLPALRRARRMPERVAHVAEGKRLRYKGTVPYQDLELDRRTFFGRDRESHALRSLVLAERLVVLFGKSGMGKTSLINAGVVEPLREMGYLPLVVRLADRKRGPSGSLLSGVRTAAEEAGVDVVVGDPSSVWSFFKTAELWSPRDDLLRPVLIVDQFEELFTLHAPGPRREFIAQLAELVRGRIAVAGGARGEANAGLGSDPPDLKIVLSVREDFLADLEDLAGDIPEILHRRFRLGPLSLDGAREAIVGPAALADAAFDSARFSYREEVVERIISFLARRRHGAEIVSADSVEPVQLQLVCHYLEEVMQARQSSSREGARLEVSEADLGDEAQLQRVLESFYDRTVAAIESPWERRRVRRLCERRLISSSGRRLTEDEEEIEKRQKVSRLRLQALVDSRLLRPEPRLGGIYYELSHDTLVEPIQRSRSKRVSRHRLLAGGVTAAVMVTGAGLLLSRPETVGPRADAPLRHMIGVDYEETVREETLLLKRYLESEISEYSAGSEAADLDLRFYGHEAAIERLLNPPDEWAYIARLPAYVCVVAELLGAGFEVVGTFRSRAALERLGRDLPESGADETDGYTYRTYFVLNRESLERRLGFDRREVDLPTLEAYLKSFGDGGARFVYHSKFSTSSFFLPSAYFRDQGLIDLVRARDLRAAMGRPGEVISSKMLVESVATGEADLAAVWEGTRVAFESGQRFEEYGSKVVFLPSEQEVPNDLLVVSRTASLTSRGWVLDALDAMPPLPDADADARYWRPIDARETRRARNALAALRQLARAQVSPVTVRIETDERSGSLLALRAVAEEAIRNSATELVPWSESYARDDYRWRLGVVHDGSVLLESDIDQHGSQWVQEFQISFANTTDLRQRIEEIIRSRLHRLRYVWPYSDPERPTILRDIDFSVPEGGAIEVQEIRWRDRSTNEFRSERIFQARVMAADAHRFLLSSQGFDGEFDPMGPIAYRAVLPRRERERSAVLMAVHRLRSLVLD